MSTRVLRTVGTDTTPQCFGLYQGSVVNTNDPLLQGRVQLFVPQVLGTANSNWAKTLGQTSLLAPVVVGQPVFVMFIGGDRNQPTYIPLNWLTSSAITLPGTLTVTGATTLSSTLAVTGTSTHTGMATFNGGATVTGGATVDIVNGTLKTFKSGNTSRSFSTTTPANDPDLQNIPYVANGIYIVELCAFTADNGNLQYTFNFTSSPPNAGRYQAIQNNLSSQFQGIQSGWTANNTANTTEPVLIKGLFNNTGGAAGLFSFQWCNNTSNSQATVQSASYLKLERLA